MNRLEKLRALQLAIREWLQKQGEPFDTRDLAGRFGLRQLTAKNYLNQLQAEGRIRQVSKEHFGECARYEVNP